MNRLDGIGVKTERANKHIAELDSAIQVFLDSHPYDVAVNRNSYTGSLEWILTKSTEIPAPIPGIMGDAIQNLRSALDYLIYQLILANCGHPKPGVTGFPIAQSFQEYTSAKFKRRIEGVRPDIIPAIDRLEPYHGGNEFLWCLHSLNNIDKHRLLLPAVSAVTHHHMLPSQRERMAEILFSHHPDASGSAHDLKGVFIPATAARFPLKIGEVCLSVPESEMENDFTFRFGIAFNEPGLIEGKPVIETLQHFADLVGQIISVFDPYL